MASFDAISTDEGALARLACLQSRTLPLAAIQHGKNPPERTARIGFPGRNSNSSAGADRGSYSTAWLFYCRSREPFACAAPRAGVVIWADYDAGSQDTALTHCEIATVAKAPAGADCGTALSVRFWEDSAMPPLAGFQKIFLRKAKLKSKTHGR